MRKKYIFKEKKNYVIKNRVFYKVNPKNNLGISCSV